jgi:hypothetical protein
MAMETTDILPGSTILSGCDTSTINGLMPLRLDNNRKNIILATNDVNDTSLYLNGLTQNIVILYDLFEAMGYKSWLLQYTTGSTEKRDFIHKYRTIVPKDIIVQGMPVFIFIEIGMSVDPTTRAYLRSVGAKIVKLYLGNILNIDIETSQNFSNMFFGHHIVGEIDEVWTSPHYFQHIDYAASLNRTDINKSRIAPYVWDPCFVNHYGTKEQIEWRPVSDWRNMDIVIMDPNISFQKCYFYSLLLVEAFYRRCPEWRGSLHMINGDRLKIQTNAMNFVLPELSLEKDKKLILHSRKNFHSILTDHKSACFITHQLNNDLNYMTLELLYCGYPVLHNSDAWSQFGYHYDINKWNAAIDTLENSLKHHNELLSIYKSHAANLIWRHSIHNMQNQNEWRHILEA